MILRRSSGAIALLVVSTAAALGLAAAACGSSGADATAATAATGDAQAPGTNGDDDAGGSGDRDARTGDDGTDAGEDLGDTVVTPKDGGAGFPGAYSSPTIVREGSVYHAYFAQQTFGGKHYNVPHATFTETGGWTVVGEALPHLGAQADDGPGRYTVWAPSAAKIGPNRWMLYYTAHLAGTVSKKCIWRAHATSPEGPFVDDYAGPIVCSPSSETLWTIDPYLVADAQGTWNLAARVDQAGGINTISLHALDANADQLAGASTWTELTHNSPTSWEQPVMENAGIVRLAPPGGGSPHWFVFYSGGAWSDDSYAVGYADCGVSLAVGACTKGTPNGPWLATDKNAGVFGPGTPTFVTNAAGDTLMMVQAWQYSGGKSNPKNDGQIMRTYAVTIDASYTPTATLVRVDL